MSFQYLHDNHISDPTMVAIVEGTGSGTKLLQSLLDSHSEILMVPGYALMYFYPYWEKYVMTEGGHDWELILDGILLRFSSIIDTRINPGSESLNELGDRQDQSLSIDVDKFKEFFLHFTENEVVAAKTALVAIHYAYAYANGDSLESKKIIVYHIHVFFYARKYLYQDFPELKVIAAIRDPRTNIRKRVVNSIIKPNQTKFRDSDEFLMRQTAYRHIIRFSSEGLDSLYPISPQLVRVFKHEDLVLRLEDVMRRLAVFLDITFIPGLLKPTWGGVVWNTTYYDFDSRTHVANPNVLSKDWIRLQSKSEIFFIEGLNYDSLSKFYEDPIYYKDNSLLSVVKLVIMCFFPQRIERKYILELLRFDKYMGIIMSEMRSIHSLRSYQNNLFFSLKWTNDGINFEKLDCCNVFNVSPSTGKELQNLFKVYYFFCRLLSYFMALLYVPYNLISRVATSLSVIKRRLSGRRFLPEFL